MADDVLDPRERGDAGGEADRRRRQRNDVADLSRRGTGLGTALARAARALLPAGIPLAACVSPANVPSLRALLAAGFDPVGSVQVYRPHQ